MSSKYNAYAREMNDVAQEAFEKLTESSKKLAEARQKMSEHPQKMIRAGVPIDGVTARKIADAEAAKANFLDAQESHRAVINSMDSYRRRISQIRDELESQLTEDYTLKPEDVDPKVLALLNSGIADANDLEKMLDNAISTENYTTVRLMQKHLKDAHAKAVREGQPRDITERLALMTEKASRRNISGSEYLDQFDEINKVFEICVKSPDAMIPKWAELVSEAIEEF